MLMDARYRVMMRVVVEGRKAPSFVVYARGGES
jgi:hypothetical protein